MGAVIQERELRLVGERGAHATIGTRGLSVAICLGLLAIGLLATWRGADRWRSPLDARSHVQETLALALAKGNRSPEVLDDLRLLRTELGLRPLDSKSRVQYAALLLAMTRSLDDTRAASFHAALAADLAPVTLPVVELAALILARSGDTGEALIRVREIFEFDADAGADLLLRLEDSLPPRRLNEALANTSTAWLAWARALVASGRPDASISLLQEAAERWPGDFEIDLALARLAGNREDWDALERWTAREEIPAEGRGLELLALRARVHVERGRNAEAENDLRTVQAAADGAPHLLILIGDVQLCLGKAELARGSWNQALFQTDSANKPRRIALLVRLADLEETDGRASVALRHWRSVIDLDPEHPRARRRVAELTGSR